MGRLAFFFIIADIILTAAALISCLSAEDEDVRALPRVAWILIILVFSPVGAIAWFFAGRERAPGGFPESDRPHRTIAPDDDPEFLKRLDRHRREREAAWEADREEEQDD